ncbi:GNAT family N-acetyltransferase [Chlorobium sp. N1]|uniref:GNAT family N-acetyltransferase n=1 Tax=Chlorobium sp. N1 TaxID=2491138 RepID=UPI001038BB3A|nr:GNAT family N-acetyltransferase [Chlorobium sp. N1]TCD47393.1 GNAT family N-acetyltransferase [Chlorobium sp. N1]
MDPLIRTAEPRDIEACSELLTELFSLEKEFAADTQKQRRGLEMILERPESGRVFVAELDGSIAGMLILLSTVSTVLGQKVALLEDMVVDPRFRRRGIGSALLDHALETAAREDVGRITLLTDGDNLAAHALYRSKGFLRSSMAVFRKLAPLPC